MDNILEDSNIAFHGINFDYFKLLSILQTGILSHDAAVANGIKINRNYDGYNGNSQVSLSESPSIHGTYNHGAFNVFVKNGISFVIDISNLYCMRDMKSGIPSEGYVNLLVPRENINFMRDTKSGIPGEVYVNYSVPRENIIGIMLPEQALQTSINQLNIFADMGIGYVNSYAISFIDKINSTFGTDFDKEEIFNLIEKKKSLSGDFFDKMKQEETINKQINETITRLFDLGFREKYNLSESPTLMNTITVLTNGNIPIYSTNGELLSERKSKKL